MKEFLSKETLNKIFMKHLEDNPEILENLNTLSEEDEKKLFCESSNKDGNESNANAKQNHKK